MADSLVLTAEDLSSSIVVSTRRTRPRFFDGKFLTAADLTQEQSYLLARQADLGRTLGFGVVEGLRVTRSDLTASKLPNPAASVTVTRGHGLTPAGDIVFLPEDLTVDLTNIPQMQRLSAAFGLTGEPQQAFRNLSGLYVLGLRAVEFTANPTPSYPPSVDGNTTLRDGEVIEATAFTIVPYDADASRRNPNAARARAAREIFLEQKPTALPAGVLPLAMLYLGNGTLAWVDEWLVRREAGDDDRFGFGFAPRALSEAHFYQYQQMLKLAPSASDGLLTAQSFLEILPPAGPLPKGVINPADFTQAYFPPEARVELALVPEDELPALMEDSVDLPPIDLALKPEDQDALAILILATVPRANYAEKLQPLSNKLQDLRPATQPRLSQQKPLQALIKLNATFELRNSETGDGTSSNPQPNVFFDAAWSTLLTSTTSFWYIRRRNLPDGAGLAGRALPTPPSTGTTSTAPTAPTFPPRPNFTDILVDRVTKITAPASSEAESKLAKALQDEGLWARFAFLRAISDIPTHTTLVRLLNHSLVLANPILQHGIFTAIEKSLPALSESSVENFEQIQKDSALKVLTPIIVAKAANPFVDESVLRGLQIATHGHPGLLERPRLRFVLGRTNRLHELAQIGLKFSKHDAFAKLIASVVRHASTGRAQAVSDAIDKFLKQVNA